MFDAAPPIPPPEPPITAVTAACTKKAAEWQRVPLNLLQAILVVEGGKPGQRVNNTNGSYDMGPAQINSLWLPSLAEQGLTGEDVTNNGCINVFVAAWILQQHYVTTGDYWQAVGRYHSKTPALNARYQLRINEVLKP